MQIKLTIKGQKLAVCQETIAEQTIDYLEAEATFSSEWNGLTKFVHFTKGEENYVIMLENDKITKDMHLNLSKGEWIISLHGNQIVEGEVVERITTTVAQLYVKSTGNLNGELMPDIPPTVAEQILAKAQQALETSESAKEESSEALNLSTEAKEQVENVAQRLNDKAEKSNTYTKQQVDKKIAQATPSDYEEVKEQVETNKDNIETIQGLIPNQASEDNQLADKDFVNSSIATNTSTFIGTFNSVAELEAYSGVKTNNDYAFVVINDSTTGFVKEYDRYKWTGTQWLFEYSLNNSSFTAKQWATINSGLTSDDVEDLHKALEIIATFETSKQDTLVSGENIKTLNQQSILGRGDIKVMQYYEVTYEYPNIVKDGVIQTYEMLKDKFEDERYWLYLRVNGVCFLPLGTIDAESRGVLQFNTQYEATNADDGIRYERIEINSENVVSTKFVHFEVTENKSKTINARNKDSETSYPSNKAMTGYVDGHIPSLDDYVKNTDYASYSKGGVIKTWSSMYGYNITNDGFIYPAVTSYEDYLNKSGTYFVGKITLDNVLNARIGVVEQELENL